eukprot:scaffold3529_cov271-Amphora_coffeaeformis.AAC.1
MLMCEFLIFGTTTTTTTKKKKKIGRSRSDRARTGVIGVRTQFSVAVAGDCADLGLSLMSGYDVYVVYHTMAVQPRVECTARLTFNPSDTVRGAKNTHCDNHTLLTGCIPYGYRLIPVLYFLARSHVRGPRERYLGRAPPLRRIRLVVFNVTTEEEYDNLSRINV